MQCLNIFDLKRFQVQVIEPEYSDAVLQIKAKHETLEEVGSLLDGADVLGRWARPQLDHLALSIHPDLQLHVLDQCFENAVPILAERREAVPRHGNFPIFTPSSRGQIAHLNFIKFDLLLFSIFGLLLHCLKLC